MRGGVYLVLSLVVCACGSQDANLFFEIHQPASEDPFEGVGVLRVAVERGGPNQIIQVAFFSPDDTRIPLPALPSQGRVRALVDGWSGSAEAPGAWLATGVSSWVDPKEGSLTVPICVCKIATFQAGSCECL